VALNPVDILNILLRCQIINNNVKDREYIQNYNGSPSMQGLRPVS